MQKPCVRVREDHAHNRDLPLSKQIKGKSEFFNTGCVPANQKDKRKKGVVSILFTLIGLVLLFFMVLGRSNEWGGEAGSMSDELLGEFIDIVAWRQTAEFVSRYFTKGRMAVVEGRLQIRDWTDKDGGKRRSAEVVADNVYFGDSKRDGEAGGGSYAPRPTSAPASDYASAPEGDRFAELSDDDGELPF